MSSPGFVKCHDCNRGGNGNATNKCSCGWRINEPSTLGCFLGDPIVVDRKPAKPLTRSQKRYRKWLSAHDSFGISFGEFMKREKEFEAIR